MLMPEKERLLLSIISVPPHMNAREKHYLGALIFSKLYLTKSSITPKKCSKAWDPQTAPVY
jgi:hypothetical protein